VTDPTRLFVNGQERRVTAAPNTPLLYVLRNDLRLTGPRFGCGLAQCGSCNVLLDGQKTQSCDTPLWACQDKQVTTVEGLSTDGQLHPLQRAFVEEQAAQCGYCLSGVLISAKALLDANPRPTEGQIRAALDDNLCRCGSHNRIVRAIQRVAGTGPAQEAG
jgi:nicotinate dehydrogenase subunit A